jgi:hypothetical protein
MASAPSVFSSSIAETVGTSTGGGWPSRVNARRPDAAPS